MPNPVLLASLLVAPGPQDLRGEIEVAATALAVSPAGELWIGARDGRVFVSRDWNQSWSEVEVGPHSTAGGESAGEEIAHIRFFDAERALIAGRLGLETKNEILRTTDGGRTWVRVPLGVPHGLTVWVSDAQVFADGHAWLAGSTGVLASQDFGATWQHVAGEPFEGAAPCSTVCFRTPELARIIHEPPTAPAANAVWRRCVLGFDPRDLTGRSGRNLRGALPGLRFRGLATAFMNNPG